MDHLLVDAGPFIHLSQINQLSLLQKFPSLYTTISVISEITPGGKVPVQRIRKWRNLEIVSLTVKDKTPPKIEKVITRFNLHKGERDVIHLAGKLASPIILTDDLAARGAAENLGFEVHGTVGVIAYAFHNEWLSFQQAENSLMLLYKRSTLFITFAIIEKAIAGLRRFR